MSPIKLGIPASTFSSTQQDVCISNKQRYGTYGAFHYPMMDVTFELTPFQLQVGKVRWTCLLLFLKGRKKRRTILILPSIRFSGSFLILTSLNHSKQFSK